MIAGFKSGSVIWISSCQADAPSIRAASNGSVGRLSRAAERVKAIVAPPVHYGQCSSTRNHPGTVTLTGDTLRSVAGDLIRSFSRQGFKKIVLFSGHAGRIHMAALSGIEPVAHLPAPYSLAAGIVGQENLILALTREPAKVARFLSELVDRVLAPWCQDLHSAVPSV